MWQCCTRYSTVYRAGTVAVRLLLRLQRLLPRLPSAIRGPTRGQYSFSSGEFMLVECFGFQFSSLFFFFFACFYRFSSFLFFFCCTVRAFSITLQHLFASSAEKGNRVKPHAWEILCSRLDMAGAFQWPRGSHVQLVPSKQAFAILQFHFE